ncbi:MAG: MerR family transcriptional regulator [bacterium]|nr:MerR family transcriptional regulator [bacterium]
MQRYKIGQLSKTMGVSTHLLKHYEKFNLVSPIKDDSTNYRYYDVGQCTRIITSKKFRNMGFSLKDTAMLVNEMETEAIDDAVDNQIKALEEQIKELEHQKYLAMQYKQDSQETNHRLGEWYVEEVEEFYFIKQTDNYELLQENTLEEMGENLLDGVPIAKSMVWIKASTFTQEDSKYHWGLALESKKLAHMKQNNFNFNQNYDNVFKVEKQRAFVTFVKVEAPYMSTGRLIQEIVKQYQMFDLMLTKDVYAEIMKLENVEDSEVHYFRVIIPL